MNHGILLLVATAALAVVVSLATTTFAQQQALSGIRIKLTCPQNELQDFTTAMSTNIDLLRKRVQNRLAHNCLATKKSQFTGFSVHNSHTLELGMDSSKNALLAKRCFGKGRKTFANSCTITNINPVVACNTSYEYSVGVRYQLIDGFDMNSKSNFVRPMRDLGAAFAKVCGIDECDVNMWNVDAVSLTGDGEFTMKVKDNVTASILDKCVGSNVIKVRGWFFVRDVFVTPCVAPTISSTTDWILGCPGDSCTSVCSASNGTCTIAPMNALDTTMELMFVSSALGGVCNSFYVNDDFGDYPAFNGQSCQGVQGGSDCDSTFSTSARFCCCGANCPTSSP
eukprot:m.11241 g.11241  ORF g.11241 m.11241 type:complete len:339 (-) comp3804_c0_seq1:41-1057(-)